MPEIEKVHKTKEKIEMFLFCFHPEESVETSAYGIVNVVKGSLNNIIDFVN